MSNTKRIVYVNGDIICEPEHYHESLKWGREMVDKMEADNVDRSDMLVVIERLEFEIRFSLAMLNSLVFERSELKSVEFPLDFLGVTND